MSAISTVAARLAALPEDKRRAALAGLGEEELAALEYSWPFWARPEQLPPPRGVDGNPDWRTWLILTGRGWGKTRTSAESTRARVEDGRAMSIGLIGPTADTLRRDQVRAIVDCSPPWCKPTHEASQRRLVWPNGAIAYCLSSEEPDRIRGLNLDLAWGDELTSWANADECWSNLQLALRVPGPKGDTPHAVISTTPKRQRLLREIVSDAGTVVTRGSTFSNAANLDGETLRFLTQKYGGTTLGRQELEGDLLDDLDGALWHRAMLDESRVAAAPELKRIVVAIDPAGSSGANSDETGIIAVGLGRDDHGYVLADASGRHTPEKWARQAVNLLASLRGDCLVCESNFGGQMVEATIRAVAPFARVKMVHASRGKAVRAEPIVAFYEQRRVHHVGHLPGLEDQLCGWDPNGNERSPDRLDALVWGLTELMAGPRSATVSPLRI